MVMLSHQWALGSLYFKNLDYKKAMEWYLKAANNGNAKAQYNLGAMYVNGIGVKSDYVEARKWLEKAATQGNQQAINLLRQIEN